jgi:hypothetical protein
MSAEERLEVLAQRRDEIRDWLSGEASFTRTDQKHLDSDTPEQAYWHHGYQSALDDIIKFLSA